MIDYTYYKETYGGDLTEKEFTRLKEKAMAYLRGATRGRPLPAEDTAVRFCLCELCEIFAKDTEGIASESVDGFSVSYTGKSQNAAFRAVQIYMAPIGVLYGGAACENL